MSRSTIALKVPNAKNPDECFSFRLQQNLQKEPSVFSSVDKILIIVDLKGDFDRLRKILVNAGVIDRKYHWIFGSGHLVMLGNCFDVEQNCVECLWFIYSLEERARRKGGYVHYILGDADIRNINGEWRHTHPNYITNNNFIKVPIVALYDANNQLRKWLYTKNIIEKIDKMIFVSISFKLPFDECGINDLNRIASLNYSNSGMFYAKDVIESGTEKRRIYSIKENSSDLKLNESILITGNPMFLEANDLKNNRSISFWDNQEKRKSLFFEKGRFCWMHIDGTTESLNL